MQTFLEALGYCPCEMSPQCTICGQEVVFIPQYQQWYCDRCRTYPYLQQAQAAAQNANYAHATQPGAFQQPPAVAPDTDQAMSRIRNSFMSRRNIDIIIPPSWAWIILIFQIFLPVSALIVVYIIGANTEFDLSSTRFLITTIMAVTLVAIGLAISHAILVFKLVQRRDMHFKRDIELKEGISEYLAGVSNSKRIEMNVERWTMNWLHLSAHNQERGATLWALLSGLPVIGLLFLFYVQIFLTKDMQEHDEKQRAFNHQFLTGLLKAGNISEIAFKWQPLPKRDKVAYALLTALTLGMFFPYWWYVNIVDMNTHIKNQWDFEDALIEQLWKEG